MKTQLLEVLECPYCCSRLTLGEGEENKDGEIRAGCIVCTGRARHRFEIKEGIVYFASGMNHEAVKKELVYENSTYHGSPRLTDPQTIAGFPDTLEELWPHTAYFGPDFRALMDRLELFSGAWVLDVGTGPCWSCRLLAQRGARVIALDVNDSDFYGLKTSDYLFAAHGIYFERILESMTSLPFGDATMDRITFNASLHHTPDLRQTLFECHRVLKPDGILAMVNEEFGSLRQKFFRGDSTTDEGSHHRIKYSEFERAARGAGFTLEYHVADHVRRQLEEKLPGAMGRLTANAFEMAPLALKQLNSALVILKPDRAGRITEEITKAVASA